MKAWLRVQYCWAVGKHRLETHFSCRLLRCSMSRTRRLRHSSAQCCFFHSTESHQPVRNSFSASTSNPGCAGISAEDSRLLTPQSTATPGFRLSAQTPPERLNIQLSKIDTASCWTLGPQLKSSNAETKIKFLTTLAILSHS